MSSRHRTQPTKLSLTRREVPVGVTWYTEEEWGKVKAAAVDPERFEATYAEWVAMVEDALKNFLAAGVVAQKVFVDSNELLAWCLLHGKPNDAAARAQFVSQGGKLKRA